MNTPSITRQIGSLETAIAILNGGKQKPRPEVMRAMIDDLKAALDTLRTVQGQGQGQGK